MGMMTRMQALMASSDMLQSFHNSALVEIDSIYTNHGTTGLNDFKQELQEYKPDDVEEAGAVAMAIYIINHYDEED